MRTRMKLPSRRYGRAFAPDLSAGMVKAKDSRTLALSEAEEAYNVCTESGAVTTGYGLTDTGIPSSFGKIYAYKAYDETARDTKTTYLAYRTADGKIFAGDGEAFDREIAGVRFALPPMGVNYRLYGDDVYLLCGQEGMAVLYPDGRAVTVSSAPEITSMAMHNERMFVTIGGRRNAVWFSDDLDPTNWNPELDEGGFIELEGESGRLNKAVAFGGYVYLFRDYGIVRLSAYGDQSEFSVTPLFVSSGRIHADTVAVCGDRILFSADDGLYAFDGLSAARIGRRLNGLLGRGGKRIGCYSAGKYYLAACSGEGAQNDLLLVVDPRTDAISVSRGICVTAFSPLAGEDGETLLVATPHATLGKVTRGAAVFGEHPLRVWQSGLVDLASPDRRKLIAGVYFDSRYDCTLTVTTDRGRKTLAVKGSDSVARLRLHLAGTKARIRIEARGEMSVARVALRFYYI